MASIKIADGRSLPRRRAEGASKTKRIVVEQRHIDEAVPENSSKCMVAQAISDAVPGSKKLHVDMQTMRYTDEFGVRRTYLTPSSVQSALVRFDAGDPVQPFAFNMPAVIHFSRPTSGTRAGEKLKKSEKTRLSASARTPAKVGGKPIPTMGNATRRRFGIRNLRINSEGQVEQIGTTDPT